MPSINWTKKHWMNSTLHTFHFFQSMLTGDSSVWFFHSILNCMYMNIEHTMLNNWKSNHDFAFYHRPNKIKRFSIFFGTWLCHALHSTCFNRNDPKVIVRLCVLEWQQWNCQKRLKNEKEKMEKNILLVIIDARYVQCRNVTHTYIYTQHTVFAEMK